MIEIKSYKDDDTKGCHGCAGKSTENTKMFELLIGCSNLKTQVILCRDCLKKLGSEIMDILTREAKDIQNYTIDFKDNPCDKAAIGLIEMFPNIKKSNPCFIEKCNNNYIVKYDVRGHYAYTLPAETGLFEDGWTINAEIQEDYYKWINDFEAVKYDGDKVYTVKGNFENEVICSSLEALEDFLTNHMPEEWDYWDI